MPIITISRGSFSGGLMLGECLAKRLGYRCIDRDQVVKRAAACGVSEEELRKALEAPPKFFGQSPHTRYVYLALIQAALTAEVSSGEAVYHGLAGHLLLAGIPGVLRTRVIAPMEFRIRMLEQRTGKSRADAIAYIEKMDQDRRRWTHFLYGVNWDDPSLYDLVLNLERMTVDEACEIVCATAEQPSYHVTGATRQAIEDAVLSSRVRADLAIHADTSDLEVTVVARGGAVSVQGELFAPKQADAIKAVAKAVPGVQTLDLHGLALVARI
jgi:cytidylate kinase